MCETIPAGITRAFRKLAVKTAQLFLTHIFPAAFVEGPSPNSSVRSGNTRQKITKFLGLPRPACGVGTPQRSKMNQGRIMMPKQRTQNQNALASMASGQGCIKLSLINADRALRR